MKLIHVRRMILSALLTLMIVGSTAGVSGQDKPAGTRLVDTPYPDKAQVVKTEPLKPAAGSEIVPYLELVHYKDQSVGVHFQASGDAQTKAANVEVTYDLVVDPQALTYTAKKVERLVAAPTQSADGGLAYRAIKIQAYDPIMVLLTETLATYSWSWANGVITSKTVNHACGAQNPTAAGTHWFRNDCWRNEYMAPAKNEGSVQANGKYSNSDWKFPTQWTYNHQWVFLAARAGGSWTIDAWQRPTGEDASLLLTKIIWQ